MEWNSILVFLLFFNYFKFIAAFDCYQCNSLVDEHCENIGDLSEVYLKKCAYPEESHMSKPNCDPTKPDECENPDGKNENEHTNCDPTQEDCGQSQTRQNFTICRKVETWLPKPYVVILKKEGDKTISTKTKTLKSRISRDCGYKHKEGHDDACIRKGTGSSSQITCSCTESRCNVAAYTLRISFTVGILSTIFLFAAS